MPKDITLSNDDSKIEGIYQSQNNFQYYFIFIVAHPICP